MFELVDVGPRSLSAYRGVAPDAVLDDGAVRFAELPYRARMEIMPPAIDPLSPKNPLAITRERR